MQETAKLTQHAFSSTYRLSFYLFAMQVSCFLLRDTREQRSHAS